MKGFVNVVGGEVDKNKVNEIIGELAPMSHRLIKGFAGVIDRYGRECPVELAVALEGAFLGLVSAFHDENSVDFLVGLAYRAVSLKAESVDSGDVKGFVSRSDRADYIG